MSSLKLKQNSESSKLELLEAGQLTHSSRLNAMLDQHPAERIRLKEIQHKNFFQV